MAANFPVVIYHNPKCETSRNALAMIRAAGYEPEIVEYLQTGWNEKTLRALVKAMKAHPRDILREKGTRAAELGLTAPEASDEEILAAMIADPVLVNRPIVTTPKGAVLARPSERVFDVLERAPAEFVKEDGEVVTPKRPARLA